MRLLPLGILLLLGACGESKNTPKASTATPTPQETAPAKPTTVAELAPAKPPEPALPAIVGLPDGVPPLREALRTKNVNYKTRKKVRMINAKARAAAKAGDFAEAIARYKEALGHDPGHVIARYNLSCAYARSAAIDDGLKLLKEFKDNGCEPCIGRLVRAREDGDWQVAAKDPRFVALTGDAKVADKDLDAFGALVAKGLADGDFHGLGPYFDPRRPVQAYYVDTYCEDAVGTGCNRPRQLTTFKAVREYLESQGGEWSQGEDGEGFLSDDIRCDDSCCTILSDEPADSMCESCTSHIEVCLEADSGGVRALTVIRVVGT